ncbi:hypothetical protein ACFP2T_12360 [Plantactinospora solaniradicis]|uniref:Uncharacterized protein n=1 Tax=Plantactinospora solaniradicis TaxID=1723736 RepID=A0ABW1K6V3_9ACTN
MEFIELGSVTAPSGVPVIATLGHLDYIWPSIGERLSDRAAAVAATGGGHIHEWLFEAVAVPVNADRSLPVRAATRPSPFDGEAAITMLDVGLGSGGEGAARLLGDLPADRCGMLLGDAVALDSWVGMSVEPHTDPRELPPIRPEPSAACRGSRGCWLSDARHRWDEGDHSMRHRGERAFGRVYPVTIVCDDSTGTFLRWDIDSAKVQPLVAE